MNLELTPRQRRVLYSVLEQRVNEITKYLQTADGNNKYTRELFEDRDAIYKLLQEMDKDNA